MSFLSRLHVRRTSFLLWFALVRVFGAKVQRILLLRGLCTRRAVKTLPHGMGWLGVMGVELGLTCCKQVEGEGWWGRETRRGRCWAMKEGEPRMAPWVK